MTTGNLALIILAAILVQVAIVMLFGFYRRKHQLQNMQDPAKRVDKVDNLSTSSMPRPSSAETAPANPGWNDFKELSNWGQNTFITNINENCVLTPFVCLAIHFFAH